MSADKADAAYRVIKDFSIRKAPASEEEYRERVREECLRRILLAAKSLGDPGDQRIEEFAAESLVKNAGFRDNLEKTESSLGTHSPELHKALDAIEKALVDLLNFCVGCQVMSGCDGLDVADEKNLASFVRGVVKR